MATSSLTVLQTSGVPEFNDNINWQVWKEQLEIHFGEIKCEDDSGKKTTLLKSIGSQTYSVLRSICDPDLPVSKTFDELCKILDDHFTPPTIIFRERKSFHSAAKKDEETISQWYARVKKLALQCKFGSHLDAMVLDQFVIGLPTKLFEKLCEEDETITVEHALRKALIMESKLASDSSCDNNINFVKHRSNNKKNRPNGNNKFGYKNDYGEGRRMSKHSGGGRDGFGNGGRENASSRDSNISDGKKRVPCSHCGWKNHSSSSCKFKESRCFACKQIGHLASVCRNKRSVNCIENNNLSYVDDVDNNIFDVSIFNLDSKVNTEVYSLLVVVDGVMLQAACDTGAPCVLIPHSFYRQNYGNRPLEKCSIPYVNYSGDKIPIIGEYVAEIQYKSITKRIKVVVTATNSPPLLGRSFLRAFEFDLVPKNMIKNEVCAIQNNNLSLMIDQIKNEFSQVFSDGLGTYKGEPISLDLAENAKPIFFKPRPIPFAWKSRVEEKLHAMVKDGILEQGTQNEADGLSRIPQFSGTSETNECNFINLIETRNEMELNFKDIARETGRDPILSM
uniref:CCHC-type domain-containing protein n=1 Tax=Stomoxys calcitrans TaxID=35570 RepID=A0A1I8NUH0_STOCA